MIHKFVANDNKGNVNILEVTSTGTKLGKVAPPVEDTDAATKKYVDDNTGSCLPPVTSADNGKVMAVVDGEWEPSLIPIDDEKIEQSVDAWLDDHPEATTTVEDGSITNAKLASSFVTPGTASAYSSSATYAVGDYCFHNGSLYRCITAITTAEAWTAAHWTAAVLGDDVGDLKSAVNDIYHNDLTKSESASGWYIYPYTVKAGLTYTFKNTSTTSAFVSFRTRYTEQGSTIDSYDGISPGKQYTFVASGDANYLRINYTAAGSFKIICRETISEVYNCVDSFDINGIKTDILHTLSAEKSTAGRVAYPFDIKNGHRYMLKNTSASAAVAASTRSSAQSTENIQVITSGLTAGKSILFTATADAPILSLYTDGAGSFTIYDYDTVRADIDKKGNTFLPYQEGYIAFTVPVNQTIPDMSDTSSTTVDSENIVDVDCVLRLPTTYTQGGKPSRLLMICHGATHGVTGDGNWPSNGSYNQLMTAFVGAGYAVFDCNGYDNTAAGHDFWGAPRGVEAWRKAYQYIVDNYNVEHEFCIYGFSMGGLTALSLAFNRFPNIKAIGLGSCVLRLDLCIGESSMRTAYGITGETYDPSKTIGSNPYAHLLTIGNEQICDYALPPIKIWYGSTETGGSAVYVNKQYAEDFVDAIVAGGGFAQYREVAGAGHSMSYGNIQAINTEFIYWFNRFND